MLQGVNNVTDAHLVQMLWVSTSSPRSSEYFNFSSMLTPFYSDWLTSHISTPTSAWLASVAYSILVCLLSCGLAPKRLVFADVETLEWNYVFTWPFLEQALESVLPQLST